MLCPCGIGKLKPWIKKILFCLLCFLASGQTAIRNSACFVSACRDTPAEFYADITTVPLLAPSTLFEPWILNKQKNHVEIFSSKRKHVLLQYVGLDPAKNIREQAHPDGAPYRPVKTTYLVMRAWAQKVFLQHQLIVLLSLPWWLLCYEAIRYFHKNQHQAVFSLAIIITIFALGWGLLVSFFPSLGGEVEVTWPAVFPWAPIEDAIPKDYT